MNALTENDSLFNYRPVRSIIFWDPVPNVARYNVYNQVKIHQNPLTFTYKARCFLLRSFLMQTLVAMLKSPGSWIYQNFISIPLLSHKLGNLFATTAKVQ